VGEIEHWTPSLVNADFLALFSTDGGKELSCHVEVDSFTLLPPVRKWSGKKEIPRGQGIVGILF